MRLLKGISAACGDVIGQIIGLLIYNCVESQIGYILYYRVLLYVMNFKTIIKGGEMRHQLISRNVVVNGNRTSIRLEADIWEAFDEICQREYLLPDDVMALIETHRNSSNRTSAVRAFIVIYFRLTANHKGRRPGRPRSRGDEVPPRVMAALTYGAGVFDSIP